MLEVLATRAVRCMMPASGCNSHLGVPSSNTKRARSGTARRATRATRSSSLYSRYIYIYIYISKTDVLPPLSRVLTKRRVRSGRCSGNRSPCRPRSSSARESRTRPRVTQQGIPFHGGFCIALKGCGRTWQSRSRLSHLVPALAAPHLLLFFLTLFPQTEYQTSRV